MAFHITTAAAYGDTVPSDLRSAQEKKFRWLYSAGRARKVCSSLKNWGGRRELNPQPSEPQSDALPIELLPPQITIIAITAGGACYHRSLVVAQVEAQFAKASTTKATKVHQGRP